MNFQSFLEERAPALLASVEAEDTPHWGMMTAQHMIEHVSLTFAISNGKLEAPVTDEPEKLAYRKASFFEKDQPFPRNYKNKVLPKDSTMPLRFPDIEAAQGTLKKMMNQFWAHFEAAPDSKPVHPVLGRLSRAEWIEFHARHLRHHLQQFGKLPIDAMEV